MLGDFTRKISVSEGIFTQNGYFFTDCNNIYTATLLQSVITDIFELFNVKKLIFFTGNM
jgi:hypothetical protein